MSTKSNKDFAAFILTNGRPDSVLTDKTLRGCGYTGPIYYVIDDEDKKQEEYKKRYGDSVVVFNKKQYADLVDEADNFDNRRTTTHVRNAIFDIAKKLGFRFFVQLDDDYTTFIFRTNQAQQYPTAEWKIKKTLDKAFSSIVGFLKASKAYSVAIAQGGDFIGGHLGGFAKTPTLKRKCMNSFFCDTEKRFWFFSRLNEDVNTYLNLGSRGFLFFTIPLMSLGQEQTQKTQGGMTEAYLESGTYVKSFYSVMICPAFVKVMTMGSKNRRLHHRVDWGKAVPVIIREKHRKSHHAQAPASDRK